MFLTASTLLAALDSPRRPDDRHGSGGAGNAATPAGRNRAGGNDRQHFSHPRGRPTIARARLPIGRREFGEEECLVVGPDEVDAIPGRSVAAIDATGAGHTICGALAVALTEGRSLVDAVRFANATALSVTRPAAQSSQPARDEIDRLIVEK